MTRRPTNRSGEAVSERADSLDLGLDDIAALQIFRRGPAEADALWQLALAITATGATNAVFVLARQSYLTEAVPVELRARALSTLGGMSRVGAFVGPFIGAAVVHGRPVRDVYWLAVVCAARLSWPRSRSR